MYAHIQLSKSIHMAKTNVNLLRTCIPPTGKTLGNSQGNGTGCNILYREVRSE